MIFFKWKIILKTYNKKKKNTQLNNYQGCIINTSSNNVRVEENIHNKQIPFGLKKKLILKGSGSANTQKTRSI